MTRTQTQLPKPLYFAAGATDLAVKKIREIPSEYKKLQGQAVKLQEQAKRVDAVKLRSAVEDYSTKAANKAVKVYDELVTRGQKTVQSVRRQKATQVLSERIDTTKSQAKATQTTATKSAAATKSRAKATVTSAKKATEAAGAATKDGAAKVG